jgi:hypothetical protein
MARTRRVVPIPKPPDSAFNKDRKAGTLLRSQVVHLRHALARHVQKVARHLNKAGELLAADLDSIKTEGDVSEYAKRVTAILHPRGGKR